MSDTWAPELTRRIAGQIRVLREPHSVQWLSDRTAELGHRVSRSTISELENGKRQTIAVDAVIVLAAALGVAVADLLYPNDGALVVEALPDTFVPRSDAIDALAGTVQNLQKAKKELEEAFKTMRNSVATVQKLMDTVDGLQASGELPDTGKRLVQTADNKFTITDGG